MISVIRNKKGIKIEEVWFTPRKKNDKKVDIISYCQTKKKFAYLDRQSKTLINDLGASGDKLLNDIHKDYRYEIRRAKRDGVRTYLLFSADVTNEMIEEFSHSYKEFMLEKKLNYFGSVKSMTTYLKLFQTSGSLAISIAKLDGINLVYHVYVHDNNVARLMYSISHYRNNDLSHKALIGMANRLLHYDDLLAFKDAGLQTYDWGGISNCDELKNITDFKRKFGGTEIDTFYVQEALTLKGKLALIAKKILRRVNSHERLNNNDKK